MLYICVCLFVCVWFTLAMTRSIEGWQEEEEEEKYEVPGNHADKQEGLYSVNMF